MGSQHQAVSVHDVTGSMEVDGDLVNGKSCAAQARSSSGLGARRRGGGQAQAMNNSSAAATSPHSPRV